MTAAAAGQDSAAQPPIWLQGSFRLLFAGGALWAAVVVTLWVGALGGRWTLPTAMAPLAWHQHEMLFGYLGAVIGGFLSAAIPNWTGRPVVTGWRVGGAVGLWLAARLAILFSGTVPPPIGAALDIAFLLLLLTYAAREIVVTGNRNKPILIVLSLFLVACGVDHAAAIGIVADPALGMRMGFALVLMLIAIIGGRITPAFTRNWLMRHGRRDGLPTMPNRFDNVVIGATALVLAGWVVAPDNPATGVLLLAAGTLQGARLTRWAGLKALGDPLVFVLHLSYAWLPLGLVLLGGAILHPAFPVSSAIHALGAGAMAAMTLAVMTRATRGHTGRPLEADRPTIAIYLLVHLGALLRVAAPLLPFDYMGTIRLAGGLWGAAFLLFLLIYGPMALRPATPKREYAGA
ncbi:NnrS family protein [Hephaestia sp. GCM10023244]|uniref:NnrS family protein n=1 Tax=unclassified Hephaestia TaxID=2631281 RepID=UPI0020770E93|nr:NnrS family protein [Hephaestia sp. MAHUQ-44]MCM8730395.1 NnrS family protein [Hephaestia sp. MAHUQ-44]